MRLLVIRHAIAEDRETFAQTGKDDAERPLTRDGREKMRRGARGLRTLVGPVDLLAASPLVRAAQTADELEAVFGGVQRVTAAELAPDAANDAFLGWLRSQAHHGTVAVVGHEPHLGRLVSWLLAERNSSFVEMKKGGACLLDFPGALDPGRATLAWHLMPRLLRELR